MKKIFKISYIIASLFFILYLLIPNSGFPEQISSSFQSDEPADVETPSRRGYYLNGSRNEVITYYRQEFDNFIIFNKNIDLFSLRLNYPPEESQTIIRDQTRSTYLEEIVHPFRESIFINGFEPKKDNEKIVVYGKPFGQKIIIKTVSSNIWVRLMIGVMSVIFAFIIIDLWVGIFGKRRNNYET